MVPLEGASRVNIEPQDKVGVAFFLFFQRELYMVKKVVMVAILCVAIILIPLILKIPEDCWSTK